jgi:hypothetical protein
MLGMAPLGRALATAPAAQGEYFIFIHQFGGWDVTLATDPRNEEAGVATANELDPPQTAYCNTNGVSLWKDVPLRPGSNSFDIITTSSGMRLGPAFGPSLLALSDRCTVVNGIGTGTVSHKDGQDKAWTGRDDSGVEQIESSLDVKLAGLGGQGKLIPAMAVGGFPSAFVGAHLQGFAQPLRVQGVTQVGSSLKRSAAFDTPDDRSAVDAVLRAEAQELGDRSVYASTFDQFTLQYQGLPQLLSPDMLSLFDPTNLQKAHPNFNYKGQFQGNVVLNAAFAIEAIRRRTLCSFAFGMNGCDTHTSNYQSHALILQETFEMIAQMVKEMDEVTFIDSSDKLSDRVHIFLTSDFCRTPLINGSGGRDHWPNNSWVIVSNKFKSGQYGSTDAGQLLPTNMPAGSFKGDPSSRAIKAADMVATVVDAFGGDPRDTMRDGNPIVGLTK